MEEIFLWLILESTSFLYGARLSKEDERYFGKDIIESKKLKK